MTTIAQYSPNEGLFPSIVSPSFLTDLFRDSVHHDKTVYPHNKIIISDEHNKAVETRLQFALAGIPRDRITVKVEDDTLNINVLKDESKAPLDVHYVERGISNRSMQVSYSLFPAADVAKISSSYKDGILTISVPHKPKDVKLIDVTVD